MCKYFSLCRVTLRYIHCQKIEKLTQGANGKLSSITDPVAWVTGNVNGQKAHYQENMTIPYQLEVIGLTAGQEYTVEIGWDTKKGGKHALDFLTSYDRDDTHYIFNHPPEAILPLKGTALDGTSPTEKRYAIPTPSDAGYFVLTAEWAIAAEPAPASLENAAL